MATMVMYTPVLRYVEQAVVTALCDPDQDALDRVHAYFPAAETYRDYDEFLRSAKIDALLLATPVNLHLAQVIKAARAGKHVMCEKPMARTLGECDEMIAACEAHGVTLMVGFMKRFDKSMRHAKALIDQGTLGRLHSVTADWRGQIPAQGRAEPEAVALARSKVWRSKLDTLGGVYQDLGSHTTDLARWWLGEITTVSGEFSILDDQSEVDDSAVAIYVHTSGARSVHLVGASNMRSNESYQLDGTRGTLRIEYGPASHASTDPFRMTRYEAGGLGIVDETRYNQWALDVEQASSARYKREIDHFCESVLQGTRPLTSADDGRKAVEAVNAVYLSAYLGEKIRLPLEITPDLERIFVEMKSRTLQAA
jgi:predicted dehydrogenase